MKKFFDVLGKLVAFILAAALILKLTNDIWGYLNSTGIFLDIINYVVLYGTVVLIGLVLFEAMSGKNFVFKLIILLIVAALIVFSFTDLFKNVTDTAKIAGLIA